MLKMREMKMGLIGAILGDIAGSRWEFGRPKDLNWRNIKLFTDDCFFTDDSVLSVGTKWAVENNKSFAEAYYIFSNKYPGCSYGGSFCNWMESTKPMPYNQSSGRNKRCCCNCNV